MALTTTFAEMRSKARQYSDQQGSTLCDETEVGDYVNGGIRALVDFLIVNNAAAYFQAIPNQTIAIVSGTDTYALAADFYKLLNIFWDPGVGRLVRMQEVPPNDDEDQLTGSGWFYSTPPRYELIGDNVRFVPMPSGTNTVTIKYVAAPTKLVLDGATFNGWNGWEEYPQHWAAKKMARKEDNLELVAELDQELKEIGQRILIGARRNHGEPKRVQDTSRDRMWAPRRWK